MSEVAIYSHDERQDINQSQRLLELEGPLAYSQQHVMFVSPVLGYHTKEKHVPKSAQHERNKEFFVDGEVLTGRNVGEANETGYLSYL